MTTVQVVPGRDFSEAHYQRWLELHRSSPELDSAFFHPELTRITASVRDDVEVAIINDGSQTVGYFPFQRSPRGASQAVVGRLSEFHGVIADPTANWSPGELMKGSGLASWHFDHLPVSQMAFADHVWGQSDSPYMDLSDGYQGYRDQLKGSGKTISQIERKARKFEREIGPVRFDYHSNCDDAFQALLDWKNAQHERTGVLPVMRVDWVVELLDTIRNAEANGFRGVMSTLTAGDHLAAVHLGLASERALHIWFPAYNVEFDRYSPGLILLLELAQQAAEQGLQRIDLGRGPERYKQNLKSGDITIAEGSVDLRLITGRLHRRWYGTKRWIRNSPWRDQLEVPLNASRRLRQWMAFR